MSGVPLAAGQGAPRPAAAPCEGGAEFPRRAVLCLAGWHPVTRTEVELIGETEKRYRIRAIRRTKLAGRDRWIAPGQTALVPKYAIAECAT